MVFTDWSWIGGPGLVPWITLPESLFLRLPWSLAATLMDSALESSKAFMAAYIWALVHCFLLAYGFFLRGAEGRNGRLLFVFFFELGACQDLTKRLNSIHKA